MIELIGNELYQWDTGRQVKVTGEGVTEVHFANSWNDTAIPMEIQVDKDEIQKAKIPDVLLQSGKGIVAYTVAVSDNTEQTREEAQFNVLKRPKPKDYIYTEAEKSLSELDKIKAKAREATEGANEAAENANQAAAVINALREVTRTETLELTSRNNHSQTENGELVMDDGVKVTYREDENGTREVHFGSYLRDKPVRLTGVAPGAGNLDAVNVEQLEFATKNMLTSVPQELSQDQKLSARENIGAISQEQLQDAIKDFVKLETAPVVRYDKSQYLPVGQARTARGNIGAAIQGPEGDVVSRGAHIYENNIVENDEVYYTDTFLRGSIEDDKSPVLRVFSKGRENYIAPDEYWDYPESGKDTILRGLAPGRNANDAVTKKQLEEAIAAGGGSTGSVKYDAEQALTEEQKAQARKNIDALQAVDMQTAVKVLGIVRFVEDSAGQEIAEEVILLECGAAEAIGDGLIGPVLNLSAQRRDGVVIRGLLPGELSTDAVNVKQFNDALGNVESALDGIIALQNALIGGGSV